VWEGDDYGGGGGKRLYNKVMNTLVYLLQVVKTINIYLHTMFDISNNTIRPTILIMYAYSLTPAVVLSMLFMLTLNIVIVCGLFEQDFFYRLLYNITVIDSIIKKGVGITLTGLTPPHLCTCPKPGPGFPALNAVIFVFLCSMS
jgi:hypothetical protein